MFLLVLLFSLLAHLKFFLLHCRYYSLTAVEINYEECPKLDGLACNFVLATPEKVSYAALVDALLRLLSAVERCEGTWRRQSQSPSLLCTLQFLFCSAWRQLLLLPPAGPFVAQLGSGVNPADPRQAPLLLYTLVWGPRAASPLFAPYIKDNLVKQVS